MNFDQMTGKYQPTTKDDSTGLPVVWQIGLNNTAGMPANFTIFDGDGLISTYLKLGAIPGTVTVSGTFGANTAAFFTQITKGKAVRLKEIWLQSATTAGISNEAFFNNGYIRQSYASVANNTLVNNLIPLVSQVHPNTFQTSIREIKDFRALIDDLSGFEIFLPASTQITIVFYVASIESTYDMNKV